MALRLRRGTDAERQLITPAEGELIYTTDTKSVYIGDGTTVGGIIISGEIGLGDLAEVDLSTPPTVGQVLKWDGTQFVPDDLAAAGSGVVEGSNYRINITADDSTVIVDTATSTFTGNFVGDGSGLTNLNFSDTVSIFNLSDVFAFTPPDPNDVLMFDGINFTPQKIRQIEGLDSTILLDTETNTFTGNFVGDGSGLTNLPVNEIIDGSTFRINVIGDLQGSIFGDDSTLIVDGVNGSITTDTINSINNLVSFVSSTSGNLDIEIVGNESKGVIKATRSSSSDLSGSSDQWGGLYFQRRDINGDLTTGSIQGGNNYVFITSNSAGNFSNPLDYLWWTERKLGVGTITPTEALDVVGNGVFSGSLTAGAILLSGSNIDTSDSNAITVTPAVTFNSDVTVENNLIVTNTLTVDTLEVTNFQTSGSGTLELASDTDILLTAGTRVEITQSPLKMASFTTTERNALTPQNGDVIYNTTDSKFQGYAGGTWVNLH